MIFRSWNRLEKIDLKSDRQILIIAISFALICGALQFWRMQSLTATMDQGIFYQVLWNTLHGHPFESTLSSTLSTNVIHLGELPTLGYQRLGQHFTPILAIWAPLVSILGKWALPILQVILITFAGIILYELAKCRLDSNLAKLITCSFYGANAVIGPCLGNFTDLSQLPICVFGLLLGIEKRIKVLFFATALIIPLIREDSGILLIGIGLWMAYRNKNNLRSSLFLVIYGISWVLITTNLLMPIFSEDNSKRFMVENFGQYIQGRNQASSLEVITFILQQPALVLKELVTPAGKTISYLAGQGLPLAFVPFISIDSWLLMGLPLLGILMAQGNPLAINWRYTYLVVPGLFSGVIFWWEKNQLFFKYKLFRRFWSGFIILSILFTITSNPNRTLSWLIPQSIDPWVYRSPFNQLKHGNTALDMIKIIPPKESVSASSCLVPHLASRQVLIRFPYHTKYINRSGNSKDVEWVAIDMDEHARYASVFKNEWRDLQEIIEVVKNLSKQYNPQLVKDGIILLQLNGPVEEKNEIALQNLMQKVSSIKYKN